MTENCWGSVTNYATSRWLADAILRAIELEAISHADFHYGIDQEIWDRLIREEDLIIQKKMKMIKNFQEHFCLVDTHGEADYIVKSKFRGINPWVLSESKYMRITEIDDELAKEYEESRKRINKGWMIKIFSN